jgi:hypothetical protein
MAAGRTNTATLSPDPGPCSLAPVTATNLAGPGKSAAARPWRGIHHGGIVDERSKQRGKNPNGRQLLVRA